MTTKKRRHGAPAEPLLNTVARSLGHAAGTLARVTQEVTRNIAPVADSASTKDRGGAVSGGEARRRGAARRSTSGTRKRKARQKGAGKKSG